MGGGGHRRRSIWKTGLLILVIGGFAAAWWLTSKHGEEVRVVRVAPGRVESVVGEDGEVRLVEDHIIAAPIAGELGPVAKDAGDPIAKDETIAEIDGYELARELDALKARVESVKAQIAVTERRKPLDEETQKVERAVEIAKAKVRAAVASLEAAREAEARAAATAKRMAGLLAAGTATADEEERTRTEAGIRAADLAAAEASLELARGQETVAEIERAVFLARGDDPDLAAKVHEAELEALKAQIEGLDHRIGKTKIASPWAGVVLERFTKGNRVVAPGEPILRVGDPSAKEVYVDVLIADLHRVKEEMPARILGAPLGGAILAGRVREIYPSAFRKISSLGVEQFRVWVVVELDEPSTPLLKPGFEIEVEIIIDAREGVLRVPESAVFRYGDGHALFAVRAGRAVLVPVTIGLRGEEWVEVREGIAEGAEVIVDPPAELEDGGKVEVTREERS
ncbi:MAG: efflux RND transporter periplasmic adaptor subunit [Planctomycetes bacterium]|nr:efflux RND transporter periplasmic adaptor subunit [Planctomycetota bacterium]